ncbi:MAG: hypothetical protein C4583_13000 [Anaerolineaceae bacterium]|jgi:drug/metabolite transporter (DMT)-like permease|nr:MAG: hypothetical protein C4583_13000 [Anaerolineaceae bacterium]
MEYIELAFVLAIAVASVFAAIYFTKQHRAEQTEEQEKIKPVEIIGTILMVIGTPFILVFVLFLFLGGVAVECNVDKGCPEYIVVLIGIGCFFLGRWLKGG